MVFTNPESVLSPKASVKEVRVLLNTGEDGWSLAELLWDERPVLGMRWNGSKANPIGNPQSRGIATWFVVPDELSKILRDGLMKTQQGLSALADGITRVKIRPLPRRIWRGEDQDTVDYTWQIESVDRKLGRVEISNPGTGHILNLFAAHIRGVTPSLEPKTGLLELTVQMIFEDGYPRLELLQS